jgi:hypothetical protein
MFQVERGKIMDWFESIAPLHNVFLTTAYTAGLALLGIAAFFGITRGGNEIALATVTPSTEVRIPEIDTRLPAKTETATFSLG